MKSIRRTLSGICITSRKSDRMFQWVDLTRFVVVRMGDAESNLKIPVIGCNIVVIFRDWTSGLGTGKDWLIIFEPDLIRLG